MQGVVLLAIIPVALSAAIFDRQAAGNCIDFFCAGFYNPVCGNNGKTYDNKCLLNCATCRDPTIKMAHGGRCAVKRHSHSVGCPDLLCIETYDPVCGSNGRTYDNECMFRAQTCRTGLTIRHKGAC